LLVPRQHDFDPALYHFKESLALYRTCDQFTIGAQLIGAMDARDKAFGSVNVHLGSRASIAEYQSAVENLRARMPAVAFGAEWKAGHGLTIEQSIELALS